MRLLTWVIGALLLLGMAGQAIAAWAPDARAASTPLERQTIMMNGFTWGG